MNTKKPTKTKERIAYENFLKSARLLDLKAQLSEQGIDLSKVPQQTLDELTRLLDKQTALTRDTQVKIQKMQQEIYQETQATLTEISKQAEAIIDTIMKEQEVGKYAKKADVPKENVPESQ